jgi:O-acetylserine/cysteine efflux transporter
MLVVLVWGANFIVIKVGLHGMPPMLMGAFRLAFAAVPAVFFVKRLRVSSQLLTEYGMTIVRPVRLPFLRD